MSEVIAVQVYETVEAKIAADIQRFDVHKEQIEKVKAEIQPLIIANLDDKAGVKALEKAVAVTRTMRTSIEKKRKELKEDSLIYGRAIDKYAKELTELIAPIEEEAKGKIEAWEKQKADAEAEKERIVQEQLQGRVKSLLATGAQYDGLNYKLAEAEISHPEIKAMANDAFDAILASFERIAARLAAEKAEADRLEREAEEARQLALKQEKDRLAEQKRLQDEEAERLKKQLADIEEAKQKAISAQLEIEKQKAELLFNKHLLEIQKIGFELGYECYYLRDEDNPEDYISKVELPDLQLPDDEFLLFLNEIKREIEECLAAKESSRILAVRTENRENQLKELGMTFDTLAGAWYYKTTDFGYSDVSAHTVFDFSDQAFGNILHNTKEWIADIATKQAEFDQKKAEEAERLRKEKEAKDEAERLLALDDYQLMSEWVYKIDLLMEQKPAFKNEKCIELLSNFVNDVEEISAVFHEAIKEQSGY